MKTFILFLLIGNALPLFADPSSCYETRSSTVTITESEVSASTFCLACEQLTVTAISELACKSTATHTSVATLTGAPPETMVLGISHTGSSAFSMAPLPGILQPTSIILSSSQSSVATATAGSSFSSINFTFLSKSETLFVDPSTSGADMDSFSYLATPTEKSLIYTNATSGISNQVSGNQTSSPLITLATYTGGSPSSVSYSFALALAATCLGLLF